MLAVSCLQTHLKKKLARALELSCCLTKITTSKKLFHLCFEQRTKSPSHLGNCQGEEHPSAGGGGTQKENIELESFHKSRMLALIEALEILQRDR